MEADSPNNKSLGNEQSQEIDDLWHSETKATKKNLEEAADTDVLLDRKRESERDILDTSFSKGSIAEEDIIKGGENRNCNDNILVKPEDQTGSLHIKDDQAGDVDKALDSIKNAAGEDVIGQSNWEDASGHPNANMIGTCDNSDRHDFAKHDSLGRDNRAGAEIQKSSKYVNPDNVDKAKEELDKKGYDKSDVAYTAPQKDYSDVQQNIDKAESLNTAPKPGSVETKNKADNEDKDDEEIKMAEINKHGGAGSDKSDSYPSSAETEKEAPDENSSDSKEKDIGGMSPEKDHAAVADGESGINNNDKASTSDTQPTGQGHDRPIRYKCLKCSRVVKDKRLLEKHSCECEGDEEKVKITIMLDKDKKSFMCKACDYTSSGHSFEEHLMCHLMVRPYQCLYCKECFINRQEISRHVMKSHNGAKMSCALRALRKAKALIKEVTSSGVISFMARVAGKVPLERDPDKKKKPEVENSSQNIESDRDGHSTTESSHNGQNIIKSDHVGLNMKESNQASQNMITESDESDENMPESDQNGKSSVSDETVRSSQVCSDQDESDQQNCEEFSKLREALISSVNKSDPLPEISKVEKTSESGKSNSDSGLKIVASFSLQGMKPQESDTEKVSNENAVQPNFIMTPPVEKEKEGEILSFLGPDKPVFKAGDGICAPMRPPPPLQRAAFHSPIGTSHTEASGLKQSGKNPDFFICGFNCLFSSMSATDFREHTVNFHSTETYFPCYYCGHRSPNESDLVRHISNHTHTLSNSSPLYICGNAGCRFGTNMVADYINHIKASHADIPELMCYSCEDTFPDPSLLQAHVEENVIHIVNCPHCPSKATDRKAVLNHISSAHPGKPKMVSVAKQLICHDRKVNSYEQMVHLREMLPPALTPAPAFATSGSVIDQILSRCDLAGEYAKPSSSSLSDIVISRSSLSPRDIPSPSSREMSLTPRQNETTPESEKSPNSESSEFETVKVKEEMGEDADGCGDSGGGEDPKSAYVVDENGVRRRIYVPMSERRAENYRCKHCTFIARDFKRMHCHERSHGMPPTRKERFKCMFCPQGFDSELKFRLHITCHPGLIKFLLYRCKKCEFDTNQKHTIVRHITCNRDRKHRGFGPLEDQYTVVSRSLESRVLECERCDYMTRHKIHMAIHYQRKHNILKDKGEFTIENLMPTDTPVSSYGLSPHDASSSSLYNNLQSPDSSRDDTFDFMKPSGSAKKSKDRIMFVNPVLTTTQITERNELFNRMVSQQAALQPGHMMENQMRKFKCPVCKYLLPKAADLKNHVKRHSEIGQITLVMFRCKYCSCMSTARELLFEHLTEKHQGKPIALVKKIVAIDTTEVDKSFAETSMEESLDQLEESLHKEIMSNLNSGSSTDMLLSSSYEQLFVIPEGRETFAVPLQCPKCSYSSSSKFEIIQHVSLLHPEVKVIGSDEDVDKLARATSEGIQQAAKPATHAINSQEEVLILPDDQIFSEPALCSRCDFSTILRREMVIHLQQNHPEISVMGRNSYPVQVSAMGHLPGPMDESCVVGSGSLDSKIRCLYENYGTQMKCLICGAERPKKFFIHVHILRHLNIYLWKCAFCAHRGLQKYKMVDHIKKIHSGKPLSVRYLRVNVDEKVAHFLSQFNIIKNRKASLDEGNYVPFTSVPDELSDQSNDSSISRQKSPGPGSNVGSNCPHSLGSEELDEKICCMYDSIDDMFFKCKACPNQFQRKFAMHRHIIISHLKVALLSCAYCGMEGVERHQLVDHILACHKPAPISIHTLDIDLHKMASDFLAKLAAKEHGGLFDSRHAEISDKMRDERSYSQNLGYFPISKTPEFSTMKFGKFLKPPSFRFGNKGLSASSTKKARSVDPDVIMLGRHALDEKLNCLYQERPSGQLRCLVCRWEFPRKYPLHRHIMLRHLKMNLVGCPYCPFEGIEKYNVSTHIKEEHKDMPISIKFTSPDVETRVRQFVDDMANIGGKCQEDLIRKPKRKNKSPLAVPKIERQSDDEEDDDNDEEESTHKTHHGGLVVAMFGKKKPSDDIVVKTEVDDEEYEEGSSLPTNKDDSDDEGDTDYKEDENLGTCESSYDPSEAFEPSDLTHTLINSYTPGSYRSPAGGKAKALDVITKIKVLKSKEGSIMKFYCEKCKFTSLHRSNIVRHIYKIHEKYQTHTCPMCNYQTLSLMLMQKHIEKAHHGGDRNEDSFTPSTSHRKSLLGPLSFQKKRQNFFSKKPELKNYMNSNSNSGPKHYACAYCYYETNTQEDILQHTRDNHSQGDYNSSGTKLPATSELTTPKPEDHSSACWDGSKKAVKRRMQDENEEGVFKRKRRFIFEKGNELIQCGHCDTKETSMTRMQDHMTWDHPGQPFQAKNIPAWRFLCKSCAVKTMATSKMKYHLNRHINYRPYTCVTCGAFFPSPDQCRRHSRAQAHEEQYTYVRNPKKESRVEELLEGTRQLALKVQEEAAKCPDFDISQTDSFIAKYQDAKGNLRKNLHAGSSKHAKKAAQAAKNSVGEEQTKKQQVGKSPQTVGVEQDVTIKCYNCEFTSNNVNSVNIHHKQAHAGKRFLWTEVERGFTCDSTGEALVDCDTVPGASMDVGYTTRMTLGSGSNTMRFKCKTCDFSSYVIQAMKSHLKSHQPKGFICPYCSRSFSGKEKLMRHQYCLHKGQPLWVIHLRRCGVVGSTSVKKCKGGVIEDSGATTIKEEVTSQSEENLETEVDSTEKYISLESESTMDSLHAAKYMEMKGLVDSLRRKKKDSGPNRRTVKENALKKTSQALTTFLCSECSYTSESLYHFRVHLAQQHEEFRHKIQDPSADSPLKCSYCPFLAETDAELRSHTETHFSAQNFQCGYCEYTGYDRSSVQRHLESIHSSLEPKISELNTKESTKCEDRKDLPLLLNLKPHVTVERIPDSVLNQYGYSKSDDAESTSEEEEEEGVDNVECASASCDESTQQQIDNTLDVNSDNFSDERLVASEVSTMDITENEDDDKSSSSSKSNDRESEDGDEIAADNFDSNLNLATDSDELARELSLVEDETSCVLGSDSDMMIMQFGGIVDDKGNDLQIENSSDDRVENEDEDQDDNVDLQSFKVQSSSSVFCSKDSTLFAAQEKDEENDDNDDVVSFDNDIMLASPLPMISLGDGVSMSPVNMENSVDDDDDNSMDMDNQTTVKDVDTDSAMLLDL